MTAIGEITPIGEVRITRRCPRCKSFQLVRGAQAEDTGLYELSERCTMCQWSRKVENVRAGF